MVLSFPTNLLGLPPKWVPWTIFHVTQLNISVVYWLWRWRRWHSWVGCSARSNATRHWRCCSIGPVDLTIGTLSPHTHSEIPTVTDNLFQTGAISENSIGIYFEPANVNENPDGVLTWGMSSRSDCGRCLHQLKVGSTQARLRAKWPTCMFLRSKGVH